MSLRKNLIILINIIRPKRNLKNDKLDELVVFFKYNLTLLSININLHQHQHNQQKLKVLAKDQL